MFTKGHQLLRRHIKSLQVTHAKAAFAQAAGLTRVELSHLLAGNRVATLRQAVGISDASAGAVPVRSWLDVDDSKPV